MFWWHKSCKYCLDRLVFVDIQDINKLAIQNPDVPKDKPDMRNIPEIWRRQDLISKITPSEEEGQNKEIDLHDGYLENMTMTNYKTETFYQLPPPTQNYYAGIAHPITDEQSINLIAARFITIIKPEERGRLFLILDDRTPIDLRILFTLESTPTVDDFWKSSQTAGPDKGDYVVHFDLPRTKGDVVTVVQVMIAPNYVRTF